jgi:predicted DsbA family dithiol-disulfide isomerase
MAVAELWEWAEYYCPFCYINTVRLARLLPEYKGRVRLRIRPFPLEIYSNLPTPRDILEQEWWLAALQEPAASFARFSGSDWPTTTLPAFEAAWYVASQGDDALHDFDLRVRRAFFAEGRNIGRPEVLTEIASEAGLDADALARQLESGEARPAVLREYELGRDRYRVHGTPTMMLADGTRLRAPIAYPSMDDHRIVGVRPLPCSGEDCYRATRAMLDRAMQQSPRWEEQQ